MKKKVVSIAVGAAMLGLFGAGANAGEINVDLFDTDQALLSDVTAADGGLESSVFSAGGDILGGERNLFVEMLTQSTFNPSATADISVAGGALSFSVDSLATGTGTVQWDGVDGSIALNPTGLGGADLTGFTAFEIVTLFSDLGFDFVIEAYTDATHWTSISFASHAVTGGPVSSFVPLAAFDNAALCGAVNPVAGVNSITCAAGNQTVDWTNLGALQFIIDPNGGTVSVDLTLDSIRTVPVPSTLAIFGLGLVAAGMVRRRKESTAS